jgi:hypothetical protein
VEGNNMKNGVKDEQKKKIILPKDVQIEMMKFFLRTSIPRKKRTMQARLSNTNDRSDS